MEDSPSWECNHNPSELNSPKVPKPRLISFAALTPGLHNLTACVCPMRDTGTEITLDFTPFNHPEE